MGALSSSCPLILLRCIFRRPTHVSSSSFTSSFIKLSKHNSNPCSFVSFPIISHSHSKLTFQPLFCTNTIIKSESEEIEKEEVIVVDPSIANEHREMMSKLKQMTIKDKKELGSYANSLGKKLKAQSVGKSGVTDAVAIALVETLEKNELLKLKILNNCPGELDDVVSQLEAATGSVVVGRIGRTIIIYRPSLTKLIAEEKKKQNMKVFLKKRAAYKASYQGRMQSRGESSTSSNRSRVYRKP